MLLNIEKSGEQDQECSQEWLVNMDPGSVLTLYQTSIFRLVQIESICRRQYKCNLKTEILLPAFSPFHTMFSHNLLTPCFPTFFPTMFFGVVKSWNC